VYNTREYLAACLDSIVRQTLKDIEIICVDDGSSDGSSDILAQYARRDARITVIAQENAGAGAARNKGLEIARGEYLFFPDSDDYYKHTLLKEAVACAEQKRADIVVFRAKSVHAKTGRTEELLWAFQSRHFPSDVFSYGDAPDRIFNSFQNWAWNKLFRRSFVEANQLRFQELFRTNDLLFTCSALIAADRIALLYRTLAVYRIGIGSSSQSTNHLSPFDFYKALSALKDRLERGGQFREVEKSFSNLALQGCIYNLHSIKAPDAFRELYAFLREEGFAALGLDSLAEEDAYNPGNYRLYREICALPAVAYPFNRFQQARAHASVKSGAARSAGPVKGKLRGFVDCYRDHGLGYTLRRSVEHLGIPMNAELPTRGARKKR